MEELESVEHAIAALEQQRTAIGDAMVDLALVPLVERRNRIVAGTVGDQRKQVTVLFSDLVDFTVLSSELDSEDVRTVIAEYFAVWARCIEDEGGIVEKFIGDAVMAVFGMHRSPRGRPPPGGAGGACHERSAGRPQPGVGEPSRHHAPDAGGNRHRRRRGEHGGRPPRRRHRGGGRDRQPGRSSPGGRSTGRHPPVRRHLPTGEGLVRPAPGRTAPAQGHRRADRGVPGPGRRAFGLLAGDPRARGGHHQDHRPAPRAGLAPEGVRRRRRHRAGR